MNFNKVEEIIEEGKFKKAVAGALLGATLASGAMAQEAKVRTRGPAGPRYEYNSKQKMQEEYEWIKKRLENKDYSKSGIHDSMVMLGNTYFRTPGPDMNLGIALQKGTAAAQKDYEERYKAWKEEDDEIVKKIKEQKDKEEERYLENKIKLEKRLAELEEILSRG